MAERGGAPAGQFGPRELLHVLGRLADGVMVLDGRGRIRFVNDAALAMFARARAELLGTEFGFPIVAGDTAEIEVLRPGGRTVTAELRVVETALEGERVQLVSLRDVSDRKAVEAHARELTVANAARVEAEAANRAKSEFLATMSHELRTPLNAVLGYAELLDVGVGGSLTDVQRHQIARIIASGRHLLGLVDEVLDLAKVDAGKLTVQQAPCDAWTTADSAVLLVRAAAEEHGVRLAGVTERPDPALGYLGDEDRTRQILVNLLTNAIKFTPAGGEAAISARQEETAPAYIRVHGRGPWVTFTVSDTGIGIDPSQHEAVFGAFVQVESGRRRTQDGSGLGLAISRRLARLMGGDITVESAPGQGARFTLWLPAAQDRAHAADRADAGAAELTAQREQFLSGSVAHVGDVGEVLLRHANEITEQVVRRLRQGQGFIEAVSALRYSQIADHLPTLLTEFGTSLIALEEADGAPSPIVTDSADLQRLLGDRHGVQRARLGWTSEALQREYAIVREEMEQAVAERAGPVEREHVARALPILHSMLAQAETASLNALRRASAGRGGGRTA